MNETLSYSPNHGSSLWIENLIHGLSGFRIKAKGTVYCDASPFQKVEVFDTYSYGLALCLGGTLVMTEYDSDTYHEMMVHPAMLMHPNPRRVCIIGGGDGGCLKEVRKHASVESIAVVDIDKMVQQTIERFFPVLAEGFTDSRVAVTIDDGCDFLKETDQAFDLILVDSYDPNGPVQSLETGDFLRLVAERLTSDGIAVFQTDSPTVRSEFLSQMYLRVSPLFSQYRPYICHMRSFPEGIVSFVACAKQDGGLDRFDRGRYDAIAGKCTYYNDQVHTGAFALPQYIRKLVES